MTLGRYLIKRSAIFVGTLLATILITIVLTHSAMDDILKHSIEKECNDEASKIKFPSPQTHNSWVKNCIETRLKAAGL